MSQIDASFSGEEAGDQYVGCGSNEQHKERNEVELDSLASEPCPLRDIQKGSGMVSLS